MKLKGKHISKYFILLAGLIFFAHAVIPHHHHFDVIVEHLQHSECQSDNSDMDKQQPDIHCHAFNLIISQNGNNLVKQLSPFSVFNLDFVGINTRFSLSPIINDVNPIHCLIFYPREKIFFTSQSLRAPPPVFYS